MGRLTITFLGTTSLLFDDGDDAFLLDGYLSRVSLTKITIGKLSPDETAIDAFLAARPGLGARLRCVAAAHTHFDHVLDAPAWARKTHATLLGSSSTRNVALGYGLADTQIQVVGDGDQLSFGGGPRSEVPSSDTTVTEPPAQAANTDDAEETGERSASADEGRSPPGPASDAKFTIKFLTAPHSPGDLYPGEVREPLKQPAPTKAFKTGLCYAYLINWGGRRIFVHPSANFTPAKFVGCEADTLYLGIGALGKQSPEFMHTYWKETVGYIKPRFVVPVHWDAFWKPLKAPLEPMPGNFDDFKAAKEFLQAASREAKIELHFPDAFDERHL